MKNIKEYIIEGKKYFTLNNDERQALGTFMGVLCGDLGEDSERKKLQKVIDNLDKEELKQVSNLCDFLEDDVTYPKINRNNIIDDIPLITKIWKLMDDNNLLGENWDLIDALEKICL